MMLGSIVATNAVSLSLRLGLCGTPYIAYRDVGDYFRPVVMKLATAWLNLNPKTLTYGRLGVLPYSTIGLPHGGFTTCTAIALEMDNHHRSVHSVLLWIEWGPLSSA